MFRPQKLMPDKSEETLERFDFKFSNFRALQVPKRWDRLFVSIVSVETGKSVAKSGKAAVRGSNCLWTETISQSIWIPPVGSSQELQDCFYKFVVAMGSARSGILGEATVNMRSYMKSNSPVLLSFPLKKCTHGTTLQVKIHCLTQTSKLRNGRSKERSSNKEERQHADSPEAKIDSEDSGTASPRSTRSLSPRDYNSTPHQKKLDRREAGFSSSSSQNSFNYAEGSMARESFSHSDELTHDNQIQSAGQQSTNSQKRLLPLRSIETQGQLSSVSSQLSSKSRITHSGEFSQDESEGYGLSTARNSGPSKSLLQAAEDTIEELRREAGKWERNARKLTLDLEILRKDFSEKSKCLANLDIELSMARVERDGLLKEVEQLKMLLEKSLAEPIATEGSTFKDTGADQFMKELENEIMLQKESNANLSLQLNRSQESNVELVLVLQELEEIVEKQRAEISDLSAMKMKFSSIEEIIGFDEKLSDSPKGSRLNASEDLKGKLQDPERGCQRDENLELLPELKEMKNNSREVSITSSRSETSDTGSEFYLLGEKLKQQYLREIEDYKSFIQELETQKSNLENEFQQTNDELSETRDDMERLEADLLSKEMETEMLHVHLRDLGNKIFVLEKEKRQLETNIKAFKRDNDSDLQKDITRLTRNLEAQVSTNKILEKKSWELESNKHELELQLSEVKQENEELSESKCGLETRVTHLTDEKELVVSELEKSKSYVSNLHNEIEILKSETESQIADLKRTLQETQNQLSQAYEECEYLRKEKPNLIDTCNSLTEECSSLQKLNEEGMQQKVELEEHCTDLEVNLKDCRSSLTDCSERVKVLEESMTSLQEESSSKERTLNSELDVLRKENVELNEKLGSINQMYTEKLLELENLEREAADLARQLSASEEESKKMASEAEKYISTLHETIAKLESEVNETIAKVGSLNQMYSEKAIEVQNLQHKMDALTKKLSASEQERNRIASKAEIDISILHETIDKLEPELNETIAKLGSLNQMYSEKTIEVESLQCKVGDLTKQLSASKEEKNQIASKADIDRSSLQETIVKLETEVTDTITKLDSLNQMYLEKTIEVENLQHEVGYLTKQRFASEEERNKIASKAGSDISKLQETISKLETKVENLQQESRDLTKQLSASEEERNKIASEAENEKSNLQETIVKLESEVNETMAKLGSLNQMFSEKLTEVENLQGEMGDLNKQLFANEEERNKIATKAKNDISNLQETIAKFESEVNATRAESEATIRGLTDYLAELKQSQGTLKAENERMLKLLTNYKSSEQKLRATLHGLEVKLTVSEYELQQHIEKYTKSKVLSLEMDRLQDEVLSLRNELNATKSEKEKIGTSLELLTIECKELKAEKNSVVEKINDLQKSVSELEDCKNERIALEKKLKQMERDVMAREVVLEQETELKVEINQLRKANKQLQQQMQQLAEEKYKSIQRARSLEEEMIVMKEDRQQQEEVYGEFYPDGTTGPALKIRRLEEKLGKAIDTHEMYKVQVKRLMSVGESHRKTSAEGESKRRESFERTKSFLEKELQQLRERYLEMSLKYAEVEAEREELVMKLKVVNTSTRRWF